MATGADNKLIGQVGEHLVCAKLGTLGFYAAPYSGNVPGFDVTAIHAKTLETHLVQVKASSGGTAFHSTIDKWVEWSIDHEKKQHLGDLLSLPDANIIWVVVQVPEKDISQASYYVLSKGVIQKLIVNRYRSYMEKHDNIRPRGGDSKHAILTIDGIEDHKNDWSCFTSQ